MGSDGPRQLVVGHVDKPHGTKGEVFVWPLTDYPEETYAPGNDLRWGDDESAEPDPGDAPLRVTRSRPFRRGFLVSFEGVHDRDGAELLRGRYLFRDIASVAPLGEGEVFYHQLLGSEVVTAAGERVGTVTEVYDLRPADLLQVRGSRGEVMIPFVKDVVVSVDGDAGRIVIDPPDGLLDLE